MTLIAKIANEQRPIKAMSVSKLNKCAACFECKSRVFKGEEELKTWCAKKKVHCRSNWIVTIQRQGQVVLYWCAQLSNKPKMVFRMCDPSFIKNCTKKVAEIETIQLRKCDIWQVKSIIREKTIYNGPPKQRRKAIQAAKDLTNNSFYQIIVEHYRTFFRIYDSNKTEAI